MIQPRLKKIKREDMPGSREWIDPLLLVVNQTTQTLNAAFGGQLELASNVAGDVRDLEVLTGPNYTLGIMPLVKLRPTITTRARACQILQVIDLDDVDAILSGPYEADWRDIGGELQIRWISGLDGSKRYQVRVFIW